MRHVTHVKGGKQDRTQEENSFQSKMRKTGHKLDTGETKTETEKDKKHTEKITRNFSNNMNPNEIGP